MRLALFLLIALSACAPGARAPVGPDPAPADGDALAEGHRLMDAGDPDRARRAYLRAASARGLDADILAGLGAAALQMGRLGQAESLFRAAVARDPAFVPALNNLGVVLMERGAPAEAHRLFRVALRADGGDSDEIRANLQLALSKRDRPGYTHTQNESFALIRRGNGDWRLLSRTR